MIVYSAIFNSYDIPALTIDHPDVKDWILFTDDININAPGWTVYKVPSYYETPTLNARYWKHNPPTGKSLWLDGQIQVLNTDLIDLALNSLEAEDFCLWRHPWRDCLYDEAIECFHQGHGEVVIHQMDAYKKLYDLPKNWGLWVTSVMARNSTERIRDLQNAWWRHVVSYSVRDQVSLPVLLHEKGIKPFDFPGSLYDFDLVKINYHA